MSFPANNPHIFLNSYTTYTYDPMARGQILSARGYAIHTNGVDPNTKFDPDAGQTDLLMRAPSGEVYPAITFAPLSEGKIFGNGYKWRIRYSNSQTGETSGMSPIPDVGLSLGVVSSGTSFLGQTAYFKIAGVATTTGIDTIELLRNTSADEENWYVIDKASNPGAASYVSFTDNNPDEDIWNNVQASLSPNPSYYEPHIPPCARTFQHGSGRVWFYGHIQQGSHVIGQAGGTVGSNDVSFTSAAVHRGREGQQFRFTTDTERTIHRIIEVTSVSAMVVTPITTAVSAGYEILDDIDTRNIYLSQPLSPCQHDPLDVLTIGQDRSDGVKGVFAYQDITHVLTKRRLYRLEGDMSEDPVGTVRVNQIADIGCAGFFAFCETPFGIVYVSDKRGVMLFDGVGVVPLGSPTPWHDFLPKTQFQDMDEGLLQDVHVSWDPDNKRVVVSYCPTGTMAQIEQLSFDPTTRTWRGPWRRPMFNTGAFRYPSGEETYLIADQLGTLLLEGDSEADGVASVTSGTVLDVTNPITITASAAIFTSAMLGASIVFDDGAGNRYVNWITRLVGGTNTIVNLLLHPPTAIVVGWTFKVGAIHWRALTGYLDLGEPAQPKRLNKVGARWLPMATTVDTLAVQASSEGATMTESADAALDTHDAGYVRGEANLSLGGTAFQVRLSGVASVGGPRVTGLVAHMTINSGETTGRQTGQAKVVLTPRAT